MTTVFYKCLCKSADKLKAIEYGKLGYEVVNLSKNPERRSEAYSYKVRLPFLLDNGIPLEI